jgi:hypothetical protein
MHQIPDDVALIPFDTNTNNIRKTTSPKKYIIMSQKVSTIRVVI